MEGTLTIASAEAGGLTFTLYQSAVSVLGPPFDADGLYQATVCP
jgi:hypothetical protein